MTSFNWKKFAHLNISPQTNREMKNTESKIMEGRWRGEKKKGESKTKAGSKVEWEVQEGDKERRDCGKEETKEDIKEGRLARRVK